MRTFLEATRDDELSALWMLIATTGLRRGEAIGLRWSDIDLETGRAQINQTVIAIGWNVHFGRPKTQAGRRVIALLAESPTVWCSVSPMVRRIIQSVSIKRSGGR